MMIITGYKKAGHAIFHNTHLMRVKSQVRLKNLLLVFYFFICTSLQWYFILFFVFYFILFCSQLGAPRSNLEGAAAEQCPGLHSQGLLRQADADYGSKLAAIVSISLSEKSRAVQTRALLRRSSPFLDLLSKIFQKYCHVADGSYKSILTFRQIRFLIVCNLRT